MTPYDRRLFVDAALGSLALAALAWLVMALVDEPGMTRADQVARVAALGPLLGALATWLVAARATRRGEVAAHALAGESRARALRGAVLGALPLGLACAVALASGALPTRSLLPRAPGAGLTPIEGGFSHADVWLDAGGFGWGARASAPLDAGASPAVIGAAVSLLAPALAWLASRPWRAATGGACAATVVVATLFAFHAAARPGGAVWLFVAPAVAWAWAWAPVSRGSAAR